ncbi:hypothetical protein GGF42_000215 [Coemansia sp. RSA 2424]|nr:hypothetical protein GGF42_000215 [Coemansia sp. RSA 2424]
MVRLIVDHVAGSSRLYFDGIYNDMDEYKLLQRPLLCVCHNFRAFVHARFCSEYSLSLTDDKGEALVLKKSWPPCLWTIDYPTHHLAKDLTIDVSLKLILKGEALRQLSMAPYDGYAFPLVRTLSIDVFGLDGASSTDDDSQSGDDDDDYSTKMHTVYPPDTAANIAAFVQRVKEMVPAARDVIVPFISTESLSQRGAKHMVDLLRRLFDLAEKHTTIDYASCRVSHYVDLAPISDIVNISCSIRGKPDPILALARRCAQTLQTLDIYGDSASAMSGFILDPDSGAYVEYPRLHALKITIDAISDASPRPVFNGAVPFPSLRCLRIYQGYPFGDDVAFRGNSATLGSLRVPLQPATVAVLKRYSVFTPTSHPKLQCVIIPSLRQNAPSPFASFDSYMQFVLSIAPNAAVRAISDSPDHSLSLLTLRNHASIQVLALPKVSLSLWGTINLIKSLPLLSDLNTAAPTLDGLEQAIGFGGLPDHVLSTYAPMGERFRCWDFRNNDIFYSEELAMFVLLLALACPNFDYFVVRKNRRESFMEVMRMMIFEPGFAEHAPRLRRLLFNGWRG